jgi:hypothetical protein
LRNGYWMSESGNGDKIGIMAMVIEGMLYGQEI